MLTVPMLGDASNGSLVYGLVSQWPKLLAFLLSFFIILNYWRLHSAMFRSVRVLDHTTIMLYTGFLVVADFIPYATNVAGTFPTLPAVTYRRIRFSLYIRVAGLIFAFFLPIVSYLIYWVMIIYFLSFSTIDNLERPDRH